MKTADRDHLGEIDTAFRTIRIVVAAWIGLVAIGADRGVVLGLAPLTAAITSIGSLGAANVFSLLGDRFESRGRAVEWAVLQITLDLLAALLVVTELVPPDKGFGWLVLVLPVFEAALRFRLRGLMAAWSLATFLLLIVELLTASTPQVEAVLTGSVVLLIVSAPTGLVSLRLCDELDLFRELRQLADNVSPKVAPHSHDVFQRDREVLDVPLEPPHPVDCGTDDVETGSITGSSSSAETARGEA